MWLSDPDWQPKAKIDLTPMIGVLAALLAIFALSIQQMRDIPVGVLWGDGPPRPYSAPPREIDVSVAPDGALTIEGQRMTTDDFDSFVVVEQARPRAPFFHLHFAQNARYQTMATLLDTLQRHDVHYFDFKQ